MYHLPALPAYVRVGIYSYRIDVEPILTSMQKCEWGSVGNTEQVIRYQAIYPCPAQALDTVIHELMHCCYACARTEDDHDEEATIQRLSPALASILIQNPTLNEALLQIAEDARSFPE